MKLQYKIFAFSLLTLAGFLFFDISQTQAGICTCCYRASGTPSDISECESLCRGLGGIKYWQPRSDPTSGITHECPLPVGTCRCCWADAAESGEMEQPACISTCTDKGGVDRFSSEISYLNLDRDCLPRPEETATGGTTPEEEVTPEETAAGEPAPTGVLSGGLLKAAGKAGFQSTSIENIVSNIIYVVLGFVGIIFLGLTLFAGFTWMMARGNEQDIEKAKKMLEAAVIGLVIVFSAYAVTYFVTSNLLPSGSSSSIPTCDEGQVSCSCETLPCPEDEWCLGSVCVPEGTTCPEFCP